MSFPTTLPSYTITGGNDHLGDTSTATGISGLLNSFEVDITALGTKMGTGASTPTAGKVLRANGTGTSVWGAVVLTTDVTGTLPVANGGTGSTTGSTGSGGVVLATSPTIVTPTIASLTNAQHDHSNAAGGGLLNGANAITDGTITPAELMSSTGSTWGWTAYTPTISGSGSPANGNATIDCAFIQIGKTICGRFYLAVGSTTSFGTTGLKWSLPVTAKTLTNNNPLIGTAYIEDAGVNAYMGLIQMLSTTTMQFIVHNITAAGIATAVSGSPAVPFTWGAGDYLNGTFMYEAA